MGADLRVVRELLDSYATRMVHELIERTGDDAADAELLDALPAIVLAHNGADDPVFTYANHAAAALWRTTIDQLVGMPSRLSAAPEHRDERAQALGSALDTGVIRDYSGQRQALDGTRFMIHDATLWTFVNAKGQAATFTDWSHGL